ANLQSCNGCALAAWGWVDGAYWLSQNATIRFATSGTHTLRIQTREDGVRLDQVLLSPSSYLTSAPGQALNDSTILPRSTATATTTSSSSASSTASSPYSGSPAAIPGTVRAENFDNGGEGVSYHDSSAGNSGGQYRSTDVDIESSSDGGYDIGWTAAGEWLNYTVNVSSAGSYTATLRVASPNGGTMHVGFNTASNVWTAVNIPATGGWQSWASVNVPVTLGAGVQQMTLLFDTGGVNLNYVNVTAGSTSPAPPAPQPPAPPPPTSSSGSDVTVVEWNIQVNDSSAAHARTVIDHLAALSPQPQVIVLIEARGTQYNTYLNELQNRTPYTWHGVFLSECPPGAWNGSSCTGSEDEGTAVLTSLPVVGSSTTYLPYADSYHSARALVRLALSVNGTTMQVMGTHLQVSNATARNSSMQYLKNWASNFPAPQLVAGDFNADPDQIDSTSGMKPNFVDAWFVVNAVRGLTCSTPNPTMQLDYWFADASGKARPNWASVVTATSTVSDHFPMHASFTIRP
ncbi:MAG TPA: carbohydrate-binding protein, partial [Mycobacteriales bacterium]|nr:carbohydrate-binding protein [Mycobacteriales bacterium]